MAYRTEVYEQWKSGQGFYINISGYQPAEMADGTIVYENHHGFLLRPISGVVYHETINDARQAAIDELHRRIATLRDQISGLRTAILNTEVKAHGVA